MRTPRQFTEAEEQQWKRAVGQKIVNDQLESDIRRSLWMGRRLQFCRKNNRKAAGRASKDHEEFIKLLEGVETTIALLLGDMGFEEMTALMCEKRVLSQCERFIARVLELKSAKKQTRKFLSSVMLLKHPEVMSCTDENLCSLTESLLSSLSRLPHDTTDFRKVLQDYLDAFDAWSSNDRVALEKNLEAQLNQANELVEYFQSKEGSQESKEEWLPHAQAFQSQVRQALEKFSPPRNSQPSNVQIAHDLFMDGDNFDYFQYYMPEQAERLEQQITMLDGTNDPNVIFEAIRSIKKALLGILPANTPTYTLIDESIDLSLIEDQLKKGSFDSAPIASFVIDMMGRLCAPIRDAQIKELEGTPSFGPILRLLAQMNQDAIMFGLAKAMPHLPSIIVQYERDAFIAAYKDIPKTKAILKRIVRAGSVDDRSLAIDILLYHLENESASSELFYLDVRRIGVFRRRIESLAKECAMKLTSLKTVADNDPTVRLMISRIRDRIGVHLSGSPDAKKIVAISSEGHQSLLNDIASFFEHHFKVYKPVYNQLL